MHLVGAPPLETFQPGWMCFGQPDLDEGVPADCRGPELDVL